MSTLININTHTYLHNCNIYCTILIIQSYKTNLKSFVIENLKFDGYNNSLRNPMCTFFLSLDFIFGKSIYDKNETTVVQMQRLQYQMLNVYVILTYN